MRIKSLEMGKKKSGKKTASPPAWQRVLDAANAVADVMEDFAAFRSFSRQGLQLQISNAHAPQLPPATRDAVVQLFESNMKTLYEASDWGYDPVTKRKELFEDQARYLLAVDQDDPAKLAAFVHFRFVEDDGVEVMYIYEIQVAAHAQRKGVGKLLMQLLVLVARKHGMKLVVLTVFKSNAAALAFYQSKLGFCIDETSPSACGDDTQSYEILSKVVDPSYQ